MQELLDQINLNHLRIFQRVFESGSMTVASKKLALTQSGVSQHIKNLEENLEIKLFDRINQRLIPTQDAKALYETTKNSFTGLERALWEIQGHEKELTGKISIGMPIEFGNNVIMPLMGKFHKIHPKVEFEFHLGFANEMERGLLSGDLDFAFIDEFEMDNRIEVKDVTTERLRMCVLSENQEIIQKFKNTKDFYESCDFISYQRGAPIIGAWVRHHLNGQKCSLNIVATVMDVSGVCQLILAGMGLGVLPDHFLKRNPKLAKKLHTIPGSSEPLRNNIRIASLEERTQAFSTKKCMEFLLKSLN